MSNNIGVDLTIYLYDNMGWIISRIKKYNFVEMRNYSSRIHEQRSSRIHYGRFLRYYYTDCTYYYEHILEE